MTLIVKCILPNTLKYKQKSQQLNIDLIFRQFIEYVNKFECSKEDIGVKTIKTIL